MGLVIWPGWEQGWYGAEKLPPQTIIIDPPVTPFSEPAAIRAWIDRLEELEQECVGDVGALPAVEESLREAQDWLEWSEERLARGS